MEIHSEIWKKSIATFACLILVLTSFILLQGLFTPAISYALGTDEIGGPAGPDCYTIGCGVGGRLMPGAFPPFGDGDVLTFNPFCGPTVIIGGPEGNNWGAFIWAMPFFEPPQGPPYDNWNENYVTNGPFYTHAGLYALGYVVPNPDPICVEFPLLISVGTSQFKATFSP